MKRSILKKNGLDNNSKVLIYTVSLFAIILWGISYIWTNRLISLDIPVTYFVFVRILLAGFVLFLLNAASGKITRIRRKDLPKFLLLAFFEPFIYFICESYGVKQTGSPTLSAMIIATIPIFSVGAGVLFFREKVNAVNITGILLSLIGIVLVVMSKGELGKHFIFGIVLLLIAVLSEVGHASVTKSLSGNYSSQVIVMYQFLIGSVYLFPLFLFKGLDGFSSRFLSADVWYPIICLAVLCSSLAFSLWVSTIKSLGVAKSSIFSALIPVVSAIAACLLGQEDLNLRQFIGIAISAVGVVLSQYTGKEGRAKAA
ncbi:MAG: EamA family transporter [Bacteroidetes bacterium]|uniref:EamA family transporter n=1 Tax=Candidatus Cryptobacteroides excrementipullorum TaxID=2840761 RepID=A0A9D9IUC5_9BACT|nr:EamA family transporter [Candidatus Cryptobacteroides excrementipullorum]